jgi:hypothetical protein
MVDTRLTRTDYRGMSPIIGVKFDPLCSSVGSCNGLLDIVNPLPMKADDMTARRLQRHMDSIFWRFRQALGQCDRSPFLRLLSASLTYLENRLGSRSFRKILRLFFDRMHRQRENTFRTTSRQWRQLGCYLG